MIVLTKRPRQQPDVVLFEIGMPNVSGYDLAKEIRMRSEFVKVAIVAISGYADKNHMDQSIAAGCDHHLVKPVDLATIEAVISHELEKRQPVLLASHERIAVRTRLAQIAVVIGHPRLTSEQLAALIRERKKLEHTLAAGRLRGPGSAPPARSG